MTLVMIKVFFNSLSGVVEEANLILTKLTGRAQNKYKYFSSLKQVYTVLIEVLGI
jgi:hypothetical protein